jgi:hypothetical protein
MPFGYVFQTHSPFGSTEAIGEFPNTDQQAAKDALIYVFASWVYVNDMFFLIWVLA